jgi:acetyl/propionyl-CoA carboxylase alpha subunit
VTEEITGVDLVEWQLRVASGEPLPKRQDELSISGHAIEARLYAEDPAKGFLPSTGRLEHFDLGKDARVDTGVEQGGEISPFYDPIIAKVISHGESRIEAIDRLSASITGVKVWPVKTNAGFLGKLLAMPEFVSAQLDTGLIERKGEELFSSPVSDGVLLAAVSWRLEEFVAAEHGQDCLISPTGLFGFRLNGPRTPARLELSVDGVSHQVVVAPEGNDEDWQWDVRIDGRSDFNSSDPLPTTFGPWAETDPDGTVLLFEDGFAHSATFAPRRATGGISAADGAILAPMPGKVIAVDVAQDDAVVEGQRLLVLEAMKMEHALTAPFAGTVAELTVKQGDQVEVEALLARVERSTDS